MEDKEKIPPIEETTVDEEATVKSEEDIHQMISQLIDAKLEKVFGEKLENRVQEVVTEQLKKKVILTKGTEVREKQEETAFIDEIFDKLKPALFK